MKQFAILSVLMLLSAANANSQTFLQHLQQKKQGQGNVVVTQSKDIDDLVNGTVPNTEKTVERPIKAKTETQEKPTPTTAETHEKEKTTSHERATHEAETEAPAVDMRKKVMRRSYKVKGYRVQVFAGGNSRADKIKAQQAGNSVKQAFPDQPIYVHFYSPRWICRMGNFRSYEEANSVMRQVRKLGFKQACVVSGKIDVPY